MLVIDRVIPYTKSSPVVRLYFLGDLHVGTQAHASSLLDDAVNIIFNDPLAYWIGTADYGEYITPDDPRWEAGLLADWVMQDDVARSQEEYIVKKLKRIGPKCLGLQWGNHEYSYIKHKFGNPHRNICKRLKVDDLGFSTFMNLIFKRDKSNETHVIRGCGTHGASNAITQSGKVNILKRWMDSRDADFYWYAHMHDILHVSRQYLSVNKRNKIINKEALGVVTGSFYKSYIDGVQASYAERKTYPPNKLGYPVIEINIAKQTLTFSEKVYLKG